MASNTTVEAPYQAKDALKEGLKCGALGAGSGLFFAAMRTSLSHKNLGLLGVFKFGQTIGITTLALGALGFTHAAAANIREKDDAWNAAIAGGVGGSIAGLVSHQMPKVVGAGAGLAIVLGVFEYTGGRFDGYLNRREEDAFDRRQRMLTQRRRPLEETIADVGEGRGICPPGYEERRRERIKEKYGWDINPVSAKAD
ncbi:related to NADH-ubiquinone oxidoreductase 21.3 kDa subunit [Cephalotrichum gorgonifer]|uniref:Related to NADH-ubiquinone oxidoreductase 21.3 kDa subunit n=1 Tax=Cephalotrichum gorgonifer TaxID=2041049 RepID=A0AAE8SXV4_9PEZI|nr:related to NADH-ubiquinone oxidoreductase 21.3 kDa subunit [Cephalotrichum gorgonifer]